MSHELRTPMNVIIGFTHLLRRDSINDNANAKLDKINAAAQQLLNIFNDILDLSKIEAHRLVLEGKAFSPASAIDDTLAIFRDKAHAKGLRLTDSIAVEVPGRLLGDSLRFSQILFNLVGNAIKFTEHGEISVFLRLDEEDAESVLLRLEVRDEGIGLDEAQQVQIFRPFIQADCSTTRKYDGTGLGLAICRYIAQTMGGGIGVDRRLGHGSAFWVTLHLRKIEASAQSPCAGIDVSAKVFPEDRIREQFAGTRILLAEDDPICREVALELLHLAGLEVDTANNDEQAIDRLQTANYAIVLMDMQMPEMNGLKAARAIRELPGREKRPFILAMPANAFEEDRLVCLDAGMNSHLSKPMDPDVLYETLIFWLKKFAKP